MLCMESPRGVSDPCLGGMSEVLAQADLVLLIGKQTGLHLALLPGARIAIAMPVHCD